ncbi:MAG TPA: Mur ligase family protein [Actinomycetota bacterium]|nr:Mur ligase family protein [Actinomycetota bacterium]
MTVILDLRVLPGPNPDIGGPAVRLTMAAPWDALGQTTDAVRHAATAVGLPLDPHQIVHRPTDDGFVLAWPVADRGLAEAHAEAVRALIYEAPVPEPRNMPAQPFELLDPAVPCVAISGTNGKTTTTRLIAHCARTAGLSTAWSSTDGVFRDGQLVVAGDYSGPGGARRVLGEPGVEFAVLETARGGLLLRGMSVGRVDVAVVTNVGADHLGSHGINTIEQLATVKATVVRVVDPAGWTVLNADEPLVRHMAEQSPGRPWFFGLDSEPIGERFTTVRGGHVVVQGSLNADLGPVAAMPVTVGGHARFNVTNVLGAASAALAAGIGIDHVRTALRTFRPDSTLSSGRFNCWVVAGRLVVLDMAHNTESLREVLTTARHLTGTGRLWVGFGTAGDRDDEVLQGMGFAAADLADQAFPLDKPGYVRDRTIEEMRAQFLAGMAVAGSEQSECFDSELHALTALVERSTRGDVVVITVAEQLHELEQWLLARDGAEVDPARWAAAGRTA